MPNKFYNDQVTNKQTPPLSHRTSGKEISDKKPPFKQVLFQPIDMPRMKDQGFQSKEEMIDKIS